jgi:hypothetical protein
MASDQEKLVSVLRNLGSTKGYVYVVELDAREKAVEWGDVEAIVLQADAGVEKVLK